MSNEKAIAAAIEPVVEQFVALEKRVEALATITLQAVERPLVAGPKGETGDAGKDCAADDVANALLGNVEFVELTKGRDGNDGHEGAGIASQAWQAGAIYRKGSVVVANIGQHFEALRDTYAPTDDESQWARVGSGGFRHCGGFKADAVYRDGDLFVKDFGTFLVLNGAPTLFAGRGAGGIPGARGPQGERGKDGRNGSEIVAAETSGLKLVLVQQHADGSVDHIEADFSKAIRTLMHEVVAEYLREVAA